MLRHALFAAALTLFALPAAAQQVSAPAPGVPSAPLHEGVRVTLDLIIHPSEDTSDLLPVDVIDVLAAQEALAQLHVESDGSGRNHVTTVFTFASLEAFRSWYRTPETQSFLRDLEGGTNEVRLALHFERLPVPAP